MMDAARDLEAALRASIDGEVQFDHLTRVIYSTDASNYQVTPLGVVSPRHADDVAAAVAIAAAHGCSVVPRGGGSSLAGQSVGSGVILDCSRFMRRIQIDADARVARVEPGAVLDQLNRAAAADGLQFGPDPASADRACLGGVVATNATGAHSIVHGMTADHLRAADVVLADGSLARLAPAAVPAPHANDSAGGTTFDRIRADLSSIARTGGDAIRAQFPRYWRRSGGYNLDRLVAAADRGIVDPLCLLAGSEGTLAVATALELALVDRPAARGLLVAHFAAPLDPYRAVVPLLAAGEPGDPRRPTAIELVDRLLVGLARQAPGFAPDLRWVQGDPAALLVVEYAGGSASAVAAGIAAGETALRAAGFAGPFVRAVDAADQASVWRVRKAGMGLLMRLRGDAKPAAGLEDTAVPVERLADYMAEVHRLLDEAGVKSAFYAHASAGCIHLRPIINLKTAAGVQLLGDLGEAMADLAARYGGVNSSEHGDGLARSAYNRRLFGDDIYGLFKAVKQAFDPQGTLNPGKIVDAPGPTEHLRYGPDYGSISPSAVFAYPLDGDLAHAAEQCNGMAVCRKLDAGAMCPSYMVTLDERHTTRARANALRAALPHLDGDDLHDVMDLCVGCKACKTECPSGVDVARLKIEVSAARVAVQGASLRAQLFAHVHGLARLMSRMPEPVRHVYNGLQSRGQLTRLAARLAGLAPQHPLPPLAAEPFDRWWVRRHRDNLATTTPTPDRVSDSRQRDGLRASLRAPASRREVLSVQSSRDIQAPSAPIVLFADTFTRYYDPQIGIAAVTVLEAAGYEVTVPLGTACCGRPALSQGLVDLARRDLAANVRALQPYVDAGLPILVLEPSCASVFRDELPDLALAEGRAGAELAAAAHLVSAAVTTIEEFLAALPAEQWARLVVDDAPAPIRALAHVHCHQRALVGVEPTLALLRRLPGLDATESDAGCCGMAGAFGYEREHHDVSVAMAERKLGPAVRAVGEGTLVVADGASCREQIRRVTGRPAVHPVQAVAGFMAGDPPVVH